MPRFGLQPRGEAALSENFSIDRPSLPRRAMAVAFATLAAVVAYWAVVVAVAAASDTGTVDETTGVAVALGFFMLPVAFFLLAWLSQNDSIVRVTGLATGLGLVLWTWFPFIFGELVSPFAAALGFGGAIALRRDDPQRIRDRMIGAAAVTAYVFIVVRVAFGFALLITPFLPFAAVLATDLVTERRAR